RDGAAKSHTYSIHDHPPGARCRTIAKNCTHESLRGREVRRPRAVGTAPPSALTCPPVIAGPDASRTMATGASAAEFTRMRHRRSTSRLTPARDLVPLGHALFKSLG